MYPIQNLLNLLECSWFLYSFKICSLLYGYIVNMLLFIKNISISSKRSPNRTQKYFQKCTALFLGKSLTKWVTYYWIDLKTLLLEQGGDDGGGGVSGVHGGRGHIGGRGVDRGGCVDGGGGINGGGVGGVGAGKGGRVGGHRGGCGVSQGRSCGIGGDSGGHNMSLGGGDEEGQADEELQEILPWENLI